MTREASFNTDPVPYQDHEAWFARKINDPATKIFIVENVDGRQIGYVRFDIEDNHAEISVSLDKDERGKGYGSKSIRQGTDQLLASGPVKRIVALVKANNPGSLAAFQQAGFIVRETREVSGADVTELTYPGASTP